MPSDHDRQPSAPSAGPARRLSSQFRRPAGVRRLGLSAKHDVFRRTPLGTRLNEIEPDNATVNQRIGPTNLTVSKESAILGLFRLAGLAGSSVGSAGSGFSSTSSVTRFPSRITTRGCLEPISLSSTTSCKLPGDRTGTPANSTMTSKSLTPAAAAGPSEMTLSTQTPERAASFIFFAASAGNSAMRIPRYARRTLPFSRELLDHPSRPLAGNGEADPLVTPAARRDRRVDSHDFAVEIHQRATGIPRVDGRVGLQQLARAEYGRYRALCH